MKKLPKIYRNEINEKVKTNRSTFDSLKDSVDLKESKKKVINEIDDKLSVYEKINALLNQSGYIFNTEVILIYNDHEEKNKIAGIVNNHIITMDNKIIKIDELKDLKIVNK